MPTGKSVETVRGFAAEQVHSGSVAAIICLVILVIAVVCYVEASVQAARDTGRWRRALAMVRAQGKVSQVQD